MYGRNLNSETKTRDIRKLAQRLIVGTRHPLSPEQQEVASPHRRQSAVSESLLEIPSLMSDLMQYFPGG